MRRVVAFVLSTLDGAVDHPGRYFPDPDPDGTTGLAYDETWPGWSRS